MIKEHPAGSTLRYRIVSKIGAGGMGEVYLVLDTKLDRKVAIKFLHEEFSKDADTLGRFIEEAKAASALKSPEHSDGL
jgi:serine/threonine protein kinase